MHRIWLVTIITFYIGSLTNTGYAEERWTPYKSESGLYETRFPVGYNSTTAPLRITPDKIIYGERVSATIKGKTNETQIEHYATNLAQTLGPAITGEKEKLALLDKDIQAYIDHYETQGGTIREVDKKYHNEDTLIGKLYITYENQANELISAIAQILVSPTTKIQQVMTMPDTLVYTPNAKRFLETFAILPPPTTKEGNIKEDWIQHTSPLNIFTTYLPHIAEPYITETPTIKHTDNAESIRLAFHDPMLGHDIFYNVYAYKLNTDLSYVRAKNFLRKKHISKHPGAQPNIQLSREISDKYPFLSASYGVRPPENFPFVEVVILRGLFLNNYIVVEETITSRALMDSPLITTLQNALEFHPPKPKATNNTPTTAGSALITNPTPVPQDMD